LGDFPGIFEKKIESHWDHYTRRGESLFKKLERPYFRDNYSGSVRGWATDEEFCVRLNSVGIKPIGCFQHCLSHGDITEENVLLKREKERVEKNNEALHYLFNKRKKIMQGV